MRVILAILASFWFMPVSCTVFLGVGGIAFESLDARDAARGDTVHSSIAVVAQASEPSRAFDHLLLGTVAFYKGLHPDGSFLMPAKEGSMTPYEGTTVSYQVLSEAGGEQVIETKYQDGDRAAWGRYRASKRDITPLASRLSVEDYAILVAPVALLLAIAVCVGAKLARRRIKKITS